MLAHVNNIDGILTARGALVTVPLVRAQAKACQTQTFSLQLPLSTPEEHILLLLKKHTHTHTHTHPHTHPHTQAATQRVRDLSNTPLYRSTGSALRSCEKRIPAPAEGGHLICAPPPRLKGQ